MAKAGIRVLVVLDGLEKTLESGRFTRNLWDNLLDLGRQKSLRYLTVSRGKPHELIRDPDSAASDFWGLFDQGQIAVDCFDDEDVDAAIACMDGVTFQPGAKTELANWAQGSPILTLSVLNELANTDAREVDAAAVNLAADRAYGRVEETLVRQWKELPEAAKELQRVVNRDKQAQVTGSAARHAEALVERGFCSRNGSRLQNPSRFLARFLEGIEVSDASLRRHFGTEEDFLSNLRTALEIRLQQIEHLDDALRRSIEKGLTDLPAHPDNCIQNIRFIVDRALDLVWAAEIPNRVIPSEWLAEWKYNGERSPDTWGPTFPTRRGHQVALLRLMTGTENSRPLAKHVTRSMSVLVAAAQAFGDFGQHLDGNHVHPATSLAAMTGCVELAATLARELRAA